MYVCICKAVTESQINKAIKQGLVTRREIAACLKVGTACGKCSPEVRALLRRAAPQPADAASPAREGSARKQSETRRHGTAIHPVSLSRARRPAHATAERGSREGLTVNIQHR